MKYKVIKVIEDKQILPEIAPPGKSDYKIAKLCNCTPMYINFLRHGKTVATEEFYRKLKQATKHLTKSVYNI